MTRYCTSCGVRIPDDARFCPSCGAQVVGPSQPPTGAPFATSYKPNPDANTAKTLALAAIIIQVVLLAVSLLVVPLFAFSVSSTTMVRSHSFVQLTFSGSGATATYATPVVVVNNNTYPRAVSGAIFSSIPLVFGFIAIALLVSVVWIILDYALVYSPLARGEAAKAESPALVLGIVQLVFGGVIPGILLIVSWIKIRDALAAQPGYRG
ncbi:MAG: zinc ribbon domain-containing protein [Candidatus Marsarchaeota archaeon]|nr:zinc ribbon domain-containing protein [Candidatus Marsarchaeota archaeon]